MLRSRVDVRGTGPLRALRGRARPRAVGVADVPAVVDRLVADGALVSLWPLLAPTGEGDCPVDVAGELLDGLVAAGLAGGIDLTVLAVAGHGVAELVRAAAGVGAGVTLAGPAGTPADELVDSWSRLRQDVPTVGIALSSRLRRTEQDCARLAGSDVRVRLTRRPSGDGERVAPGDADLSFVRCLTVLLAGTAQVSVATSDPRLVALAVDRAGWHTRAPHTWELLMPYAVHPEEQARLRAAGQQVRVHVPVGPPGARS